MWLPKAERRLLKSYYNKSKRTQETFELKIPEAMRIFGFRENKATEQTTGKTWDMIFNANDTLKDRGMIHFKYEQENLGKLKIGLTLEGLDLGRKYSFWWLYSNLWYTEYIKHHWICVVGSFLGGILTTLLIQWLSTVVI